MAGSLSNIGLGSNGALSYDIIEKLRDVDNKNQITPIDNKITSTSDKLKDLSILTTMTASLKSATSTLSDEISYLKRSSSVSGTSAEVSVVSGTSIQDFKLEVNNLAQRDIVESKAFTNETDTFTSNTDTININIDGKDYTIDVDSSTTITQLKDQIFDKTDGKVSASILNVGGTDPYKLVLKSTDTGASQDITVTSTGTSATDLGLTDLNKALDASFTYNDVSISRSTNSFDDLIVGVTITLKEAGSSNVTISQDTTDIVDNMETFVSKYNELMSNINESIKYDSDTKLSGTFQGVSEIVTMKSDLSRQLLSVNEEGKSITDYGITLNDAGILEFDKSAIQSKLSSDPKDVESFFRGVTTFNTTVSVGSTVNAGAIDLTASDFTINGKDIVVSLNGTASENAIALKNAINSAQISGVEASLDNTNSYVILKSTSGEDIAITGDTAKLSSIGFSEKTVRGTSDTTTGFFSTFNGKLENLVSGSSSTLSIYEKNLENEKKSLTTEKETTTKRLDAKYDTMVARFAAYDSIIGKLNAQFQSLSMMIEASYADK